MAGLLSNMATKLSALGQDKELLGALGQGLLTGGTFGEQLGNAFGNAGALRSQKKQELAEQAKANKTLEFLRQANPQLAQAVEAGAMSPSEAYKTHLQAAKPQQTEFEMRAAAAQQYGMDPNSAEGRAFILGDKYMDPNAPQGATEYGLNPIYGQDAQGNPVLFAPGKDASVRQLQFPEGVKPLAPYDKAYEASRGREAGKSIGEAGNDLASISSKLPGLEQVVTDLGVLADKATYTAAGQAYDYGRAQLGMEPREAAVARAEYVAMVDNQVLPLLRDTFGAAFTQKEGDTLRATLGDANKSPAEKKAILTAFIEQKKRDVVALQSRTGAQPVQAPAQPGGNKTSSGVTWSVE